MDEQAYLEAALRRRREKYFLLVGAETRPERQKRQRDCRDLSLAQDVSSKQGAQATKKASQGGGSTLGSSKKQESHPPPFSPPSPTFLTGGGGGRRQFHDGIIHDWQAETGRRWGVGDCACFSVWAGLGWVLLPFSPSRSKVQVHPSPLPSLSAGLRQRPEPAPARPGSARGGAGVIRGAGDAGRGVASMLGTRHTGSLGYGAAGRGAFPLRGRTDGGELLGKTVDERTHTVGGGGVVIVSPSLSGLVSRRRRLCWFRRAGRCWDGSSWFSSLGRLGSIIAFVDRQAGVFLSLSQVCSANRSRIVPPPLAIVIVTVAVTVFLAPTSAGEV